MNETVTLNFRKLAEEDSSSFSLFQAWDNFIHSSEEAQLMVTSSNGFRERSREKLVFLPSNVPMTGEEAFRNIKTGLRNVLKKNRVPLVRHIHGNGMYRGFQHILSLFILFYFFICFYFK